MKPKTGTEKHSPSKKASGDGIGDRDPESLLCRKGKKADGHGSDETEDTGIRKREKRKEAHQAAGRKGPDDQGKHGQDYAAPFVTDQGKGLSGRGARQQLAESVIVHQFFFGDIPASVNEGLHHHSQMSLRAAECGDTVQEDCLQKRNMAKKDCQFVG